MKIALITGGNRGIGFEVSRQLALAGLMILLTARDEAKGKNAVAKLAEQNISVEFQQIDVNNPNHINAAVDFVSNKFGHLDVLINNAGIIGTRTSIANSVEEEMRSVMETNYYGPLRMTKAFLPLLKKSSDARVINVSTEMAVMKELTGSHAAYRTSKVALNAQSIMFGYELQSTTVKVNSVCPGWVQTDMGGMGAPKTIEQGADSITWLATTQTIFTGKFFQNRREIAF